MNNDQGRGLRTSCQEQVPQPLQADVSAEKLVSRVAEGRADDLAYIERVGLETIRRHAEDFVREKLAPAEPVNDGKQTPMKGHPIFKAMHGSAMCCRGCMEKWWKVKRGVPLTDAQEEKAVDFLMAWVKRRMAD